MIFKNFSQKRSFFRKIKLFESIEFYYKTFEVSLFKNFLEHIQLRSVFIETIFSKKHLLKIIILVSDIVSHLCFKFKVLERKEDSFFY